GCRRGRARQGRGRRRADRLVLPVHDLEASVRGRAPSEKRRREGWNVCLKLSRNAFWNGPAYQRTRLMSWTSLDLQAGQVETQERCRTNEQIGREYNTLIDVEKRKRPRGRPKMWYTDHLFLRRRGRKPVTRSFCITEIQSG